jgi:ribosomal protein S18 acetylase RimI-like enzyme
MARVSSDLPDRYTWRRPTIEDADAIFALVTARNTEVIGFADFTLDDTRDMLSEPAFDPATDGWLVTDPDGALVGFGWASGDCEIVDIDITALDVVAAEWLFANAMDRAAAIAAELGHDEAQVNIGIYRADEAQRARATALGFTPATTYHRMHVDHDGVPPEPRVPEGVVVRAGPGDETFRRQAHEVLNASFADHFGFVPKSFEEWHERIEASATHDWSQLRVAYRDGEAAAMLLGSDAFIADEDCGYVNNVGVLPNARARGLARLLLLQALAADARRGRRGTQLNVDTNNVTPALGLYLSVGMRAVLVIDVWRAHLLLHAHPPGSSGGGVHTEC